MAEIDLSAMSFEDLNGNLNYYDSEIAAAKSEGRLCDLAGWQGEMFPFAIEMLKRSMALVGPGIDRVGLDDDDLVRCVSDISKAAPELWAEVKHLPTAWDRLEGCLMIMASRHGIMPDSLRN